jgi:DNA-binding transcriptional ArsR family regulator
MERRPATEEEAKALASPLRLRILRLCLDEAWTNKQLAEHLGKDPATLLHHVRTLERTGFLAAEPERRGARGARERPYRATGKSWGLSLDGDTGNSLAMLDAFSAELRENLDPVVFTRIAIRLAPEDLDELRDRMQALVEEFVTRDEPGQPSYGFLIAGHRRTMPDGS